MDVNTVYALVAIVAAAMAALLVAPAAVSWAQRTLASANARARLHEAAAIADAGGAEVVRHPESGDLMATARNAARTLLQGGVPAFARVSDVVLKIRAVRSSLGLLGRYLQTKGLSCTPRTLCQALLPMLVVVVILVWLVTGSFAMAVVVLALACVVASTRLKDAARRQDQQMVRQLPDAFRALGVYYESGLTLMQAFEQAADETPAPLGHRLAVVAADMKAGRSTEEAMERFRREFDDDAVAFASVALEVQQKTGGSLKPLLEQAASGMASTFELQRFLQVQTAQARLSARIVAIMPIAVLVVSALANPSYITDFFSSGLGLALFATACALEVIGVLLIRRVLAVSEKAAR